MIMSCC